MAKLIRFRLHKKGKIVVLAAADEELIGKKYSGGGRVLDLEKFSSFYGEELIDEKSLESHLATCSSANLVGKRAVGVAIRLGLATKSQAVKIGSVLHLQIYRNL
jgi:hypothetical protein